MSAAAHTARMLRGWAEAGVDWAELAVRRPGGAMLWQPARPLAELALGWARAHNARGAEVYIRPARAGRWPLVLLDDLAPAMARRIGGRYRALLVHTSPAGGCQVWLELTSALDEPQRCLAQRWLAARTGADPGSVSGEHLGRLAGMKNWKRDGVWANLIAPANAQRPAWDPAPALNGAPRHHPRPAATPARTSASGTDTSESGREWGWLCGALEAGLAPQPLYRQLLERAAERRGTDAERYARRTLERALRRRS